MKVGIVISLLAVAFVGVLAWAILTMNELNETRDILSSTRTQLEVITTELGKTKDRLANTTNELTSTRSELSSTKGELTSTRSELSSTKDELTSTRSELSSAKDKLTSASSELAGTQQQLDVAQETLSGLGITLSASRECYDIDLADNPTATDPTWSRLKTFIFQDQTEKHIYIEDVYDCSQFSRDVHNNAEAVGIRAAEVQIHFKNEVPGHALNAFLTTDYGLVYVDCTETDTIARVETGKEYRAVKISLMNINYGNIKGENIRNDNWWDAQSSYYYFPNIWGGESVTSSIRIYW